MKLPEQVAKVGVWCEDGAGNRGAIGWVDIQPARPKTKGALPAALWLVPPTDQVSRDATAPASAPADFSLVLLRGQAKGFQAVCVLRNRCSACE